MKVGLFIPCYINQFYPKVGIATLELLEKAGIETEYPIKQTCCGQPMANAGFQHITQSCSQNFFDNFKQFDYIVSPSGSCVLHLREHLDLPGNPNVSVLAQKVFELTEFLVDVVKIESLPAYFPFRVGLHQSCHGQRGLHLSQMSELVAPPFSKTATLLNKVNGIQIVPLSRPDECCGFGGTFCVTEEAVSVKMGKDRVRDHSASGAEYITAADMSCLMHLEGILKRQRSSLRVIHIAEILNSSR